MLLTFNFHYFIPRHFSFMNIYISWYLAKAKCRHYEVHNLMGYKTATSSGRSVQMASNSVCISKGVLSLLNCSVRQFLLHPLRRYSCAK